MLAFIFGFTIGCGVFGAIKNFTQKDYTSMVINLVFAGLAYYLLTLL